MLTFKSYLVMLKEDLQQEIDKIMADLSATDARLIQVQQPLMQRKNMLAKMLAIKQKQKQAEDQKNGQQQQQQMQQGNQTTTPGGTSNATPGGGSPQPAV